MAIVGVMAVVLVFAAVLSMAKGFERTMVAAGSEDTAIVMRSGSTAELNSGLEAASTRSCRLVCDLRFHSFGSYACYQCFRSTA